ncbi:hypothetical protein VULLAG_LOCUS8320 [Vulpes lagopus]
MRAPVALGRALLAPRPAGGGEPGSEHARGGTWARRELCAGAARGRARAVLARGRAELAGGVGDGCRAARGGGRRGEPAARQERGGRRSYLSYVRICTSREYRSASSRK